MAMTDYEEAEFTAFLRAKAHEAQQALKYTPSYFLKMLNSVGGYQAVVGLISQSKPSDGFTKLWEGGRLDLSVEALVALTPWRAYFEVSLIRMAEKRLLEVGYKFAKVSETTSSAEGTYEEKINSVNGNLKQGVSLEYNEGDGVNKRTLPFKLAKSYTRADIFNLLNIHPAPIGGPWFTGYREYEGDCFIFCNMGVAGRTGHDYSNRFHGERLIWFAKGLSSLSHSSIKSLLSPGKRVYIFYRVENRDPFIFAGIANPSRVFDTTPVKVIWEFNNSISEFIDSKNVTEIVIEGAVKSVSAKIYERDRGARFKCIEHWGWKCFVCQFDFAYEYGVLGEEFIHVHHLKPLAEIGKAYTLNPVLELRPVCPNCHAMLHRTSPVLTIEELKKRMEQTAKIRAGL